MRRFDPLFGAVTAEESREADRFFADLVGTPRPRTRPPRASTPPAAAPQATAVPHPPPTHPDAFEDRDASEDTPVDAPASEATVGQLSTGGQQLVVDASATASASGASFHDAILHALSRTTSHTVVLGNALGSGPAFAVHTWGPATSLPGPLAVDLDATGVAALVVNGGDRVYLQANPVATASADRLRWVHVPGLREFLRLPAAQQTSQRSEWIRAIRAAAAVNPSTSAAFTQAELDALSTPTLRLLLAQHARAALPVRTVRRGSPATDRGGVVDGVTLPMLQHPISEPRVYLRVISMREGKLESINAWDLGAGVSLGPVQINAQRGTLFRFLWRVWEDDRALFQRTFGAPLAWTMRSTAGYPELQVTVGGAQQWLRGRADDADVAASFAYLQSGDPTRGTLAQIDPAFRRDLAERFRELVAWPHVQGILEDVCAAWLQPGLDTIHRAGIAALDRNSPDRDTFVLKALLLSTYVRFSGCLQPLLTALQPWTSAADKLAHWRDALAAMTGPCNAQGTQAQRDRNANLVTRLGHQEADATTVFAALQTIIAAGRP